MLTLILSITALWLSAFNVFAQNSRLTSGAPAAMITPVVNLDLNAITGLWFQTHTSWLGHMSMPDQSCNVAYTALTSKTSLYLETACNTGSPSGPLHVMYNSLTLRTDNNVLDLKQAFTCVGDCKWPEYLTAKTAVAASAINPQTGKYNWLVVSDPMGINLEVYARDPAEFMKSEVKVAFAQAKQAGLNSPCNAPIEIYQGPNCAYGFPNPTNTPTEQPTMPQPDRTRKPTQQGQTRKPTQAGDRTPRPNPPIRTRPPQHVTSMTYDMFEEE